MYFTFYNHSNLLFKCGNDRHDGLTYRLLYMGKPIGLALSCVMPSCFFVLLLYGAWFSTLILIH